MYLAPEYLFVCFESVYFNLQELYVGVAKQYAETAYLPDLNSNLY